MNLIILGAGGFANTIADIAKQLEKYEAISFLDDNKIGENILGKCNEFSKYIKEDVVFYPAIGNNEIRLKWIEKLKEQHAKIATIIHPTSYISPTSFIGTACAILPNSIINTNSRIGDGCIINCGAIVDHDCIIEDGVHICLGAIVKGENRILSCNKIEAGEVIQFRSYSV